MAVFWTGRYISTRQMHILAYGRAASLLPLPSEEKEEKRRGTRRISVGDKEKWVT